MTGGERRHDVWAAGDAYERYMGRWSRLVADVFLGRLAPAPGLSWIDVGCGTGALAHAAAARCAPRAVLGVDRSEGFVATAARAAAEGTRFVVADATALPVRGASHDVAVSGLALNFLPEPADAVRESVRAVRPGGLVAAYVWDYAGGMDVLRAFWAAAEEVDPDAAALDESRRFPLCRPGTLGALWTEAGLVDVSTRPVVVPTVFTGLDDLWTPFLAGQGPAPGYLAAAPPAVRDRVREALAARLPVAGDGSVTLRARAWAVEGRRP
ncbi:class I SAM-dependent methyltransferase [Streptomyces longwoodensis]|uniref:Class I SAM-dependent methyltransferase n=2 Tax=Streptomyces TaxID=1883 RepID=A0A4U5WFK3_STRLS|nr:class I SAM-dependent methyltransferase [Streptomyces lasalocidi]TKT00604.1 class I SAM-dependent methyltransferase [Streptomyces lasalocidi]